MVYQDDVPDDVAGDQNPQEAVASQGFSRLGHAIVNSEPVQNVVTGKGLDQYGQTLKSAMSGDPDAQLAMANKALGTATGALGASNELPENFSILTAENPRASQLSKTQNARLNDKLKAELDSKGVDYHEVQGSYGPTQENSILIPHTDEMGPDEVAALGKKYGQESVIHKIGDNNKLEYVSGPKSGSYVEGSGVTEDPSLSENYTQMGNNRFNLDLDFDKVKHEPLTHYSQASDILDEIDPAHMGEGKQGLEGRRGDIIPRSYYYEKGQEPEPLVKDTATHSYEIEHPGNVLDLQSPEAMPLREQATDLNHLEQLIKDAGYAGYKNSGHPQLPGAVALFDKQPVSRVRAVNERSYAPPTGNNKYYPDDYEFLRSYNDRGAQGISVYHKASDSWVGEYPNKNAAQQAAYQHATGNTAPTYTTRDVLDEDAPLESIKEKNLSFFDAPESFEHLYANTNEQGDTRGALGLDEDNRTQSIKVDPEHQGQGIAQSLYKKAVDELGTIRSSHADNQLEGGAGLWERFAKENPYHVRQARDPKTLDLLDYKVWQKDTNVPLRKKEMALESQIDDTRSQLEAEERFAKENPDQLEAERQPLQALLNKLIKQHKALTKKSGHVMFANGGVVKSGMHFANGGDVPEGYGAEAQGLPADPGASGALQQPAIDPIDLVGGAIGARLARAVTPSITDAIESGMSHLEYGKIAGNEIGTLGAQPTETFVVKEGVPVKNYGKAGATSTTPTYGVPEGKPMTYAETMAARGKAKMRPSMDTEGSITYKPTTENYADGGVVKSGGGDDAPPGFNEYLSGSDTSAPMATDSGDEPPPGFSDFIAPELQQMKYGTTGQMVKAGLEGAAQGLIGPFAPGLEEAAGVNPEDIRGRAETNPLTHFGGEAAGLIGPAFATAGATLAERAGLSGVAKAIPTLAKASQAGALDAIQAKLGLTAGETLASKIGVGAAKAAIDNALIAGNDETSKMILGDPNQSVETALTIIGLSGLIGGVLGGAAPAAGKLWDATVGNKAGQLISDFKGRMAEHVANPDPVSSMTKELTDLHQGITNVADEVYGPTGLKAQDVAKSMPEMHDGISDQIQNTFDTVQKQVDKMASKPEIYPPRLTAKLRTDLDAFASKVSQPDVSPGDLFNATQDLKQTLQGYSKFDTFVKPVDEAYDFVRDAKQLSYGIRQGLEDTSVWGDAAKRQQAINKAFSEYLPTLKDFEKRFTTKVSGEPTIDPGKVSTYLGQLGKPSAEIKQSMLQNFLDATEKYKKVINQTHTNLGLDSPITQSPLNVTMSSLGKKTLGSKLADAFVQKGLGDAGASALGGSAGIGLAHATGLNAGIGAIIGQQALTPFFKSVLPSIAKALVGGATSASGFRSMVDYATEVARGNILLTKAATNIFKPDAEVLSPGFIPGDKEREKLNKSLIKIQDNPESMLNKINPIQGYMPNHANALDQTTGNAVTYLNSLRADTSRPGPLDSKPVISKPQQQKFNAALDIAEQPALVLKKAKEGTLTQQDLQHLNNLYPHLLPSIRSKVMQAMTDHITKGGDVPYKTRIGLSLLMGQPLDSTMSPASIIAAQIGAPQQAQQQAPQAPQKKSKGSPSSPALQKLPGMYNTANQALEQRKTKET